MEQFQIRTDLALETKERFEEDHVEVRGVRIEKEEDEKRELQITKVMIETENGAKIMKKPRGCYVTIEAPNLMEPDEGYHREVSVKLAEILCHLIENRVFTEDKDIKVLVVGLGNREVTPDALGPLVIEHLHVNRHILKEYGKYAMGVDHMVSVSGMVPGVMAQTGMESGEMIHGIIREVEPDLVIAIDALAARSTKRLNRTIQIADTGIHPGSGVGNHRQALNKETLGVPVIAIGIPTVVDAATIVNDTMKNLIEAMEEAKVLPTLSGSLKSLDEIETRQLVRELISPNLNGMFVTPKDIDDTIQRISYTVSEGLNLAFLNLAEYEKKPGKDTKKEF